MPAMDDRKLTPVMTLLSDTEGIASIEKARYRRLMADEKQRVIRQSQAGWYDPDKPMTVSEKNARLWDISKGKCSYCGVEMNPFRDFTVGHIIPRSKGGDDSFENLFACCQECKSKNRIRTVRRANDQSE